MVRVQPPSLVHGAAACARCGEAPVSTVIKAGRLRCPDRLRSCGGTGPPPHRPANNFRSEGFGTAGLTRRRGSGRGTEPAPLLGWQLTDSCVAFWGARAGQEARAAAAGGRPALPAVAGSAVGGGSPSPHLARSRTA